MVLKKKGFTLVECLVCITLLGIITVSTHSLISTCNITIQRSNQKTNYLLDSSNVVECFKSVTSLDDLYKFIVDNSGSVTTSIMLVGKGVVKIENSEPSGNVNMLLYKDNATGKCLTVHPVDAEDLSISTSFKPKNKKTFLLKVYITDETVLTSCITL